MRKIGAYGTLRKNGYNYERMQNYFGDDCINKIDEIVLPNFKMYNLGFYPCITASTDDTDIVKFDVLEVNEECYKFINMMELGAGYTEISVNTEQHGDLLVYVVPEKYVNKKTPQIMSGDWFNK
jgi:gamma-glutamylcyclotransferase (GGCT)/AIG2-like uncharacterized protein YtfP